MPRYEGCVQAKEISLCPKSLGGGANQHAHVLMLKSLNGGQPVAKPLEKTEMPAAAAAATAPTAADLQKAALANVNKILGFGEVTKAHYLSLDEDGQVAFLEKSKEEQDKIATEAKEAADRAAAEAEAAKSGVTPQMLELQKSNQRLTSELEALKAKDVQRDLEKRANDEFAGYPGGAAAVVPLLKAYATLPEDVRKASEDLLRAQAKAARESTSVFGGRSEEDMTKAQGAAKRIEEAAKALATEKNISYGDAYEMVVEKAEFAADVAALG